MSFLDFPGLQYFYNKYLKPIKPHAREETIKSYTVNEQGHVPDAQLVVQLKEENESLQEEIEKLNSALVDRRTYCIDSGYTPRAEFNMPAGTCALVCTEYGLHYVASLSTNYFFVPMFQSQDISEADRPIIIPYVDQRRIAIRRAENTSENVRVVIITPFSTITKR